MMEKVADAQRRLSSRRTGSGRRRRLHIVGRDLGNRVEWVVQMRRRNRRRVGCGCGIVVGQYQALHHAEWSGRRLDGRRVTWYLVEILEFEVLRRVDSRLVLLSTVRPRQGGRLHGRGVAAVSVGVGGMWCGRTIGIGRVCARCIRSTAQAIVGVIPRRRVHRHVLQTRAKRRWWHCLHARHLVQVLG